MTFRAHMSVIRRWWKLLHPDRTLHAIPGYAEAARLERDARKRGCTQQVGRALKQKRSALHDSLRGAR